MSACKKGQFTILFCHHNNERRPSVQALRLPFPLSRRGYTTGTVSIHSVTGYFILVWTHRTSLVWSNSKLTCYISWVVHAALAMTLYYSLDNLWHYSLRTLKYTAVSTTLYIFPLWDLIPTFHFVVIFLSLAEAF